MSRALFYRSLSRSLSDRGGTRRFDDIVVGILFEIAFTISLLYFCDGAFFVSYVTEGGSPAHYIFFILAAARVGVLFWDFCKQGDDDDIEMKLGNCCMQGFQHIMTQVSSVFLLMFNYASPTRATWFEICLIIVPWIGNLSAADNIISQSEGKPSLLALLNQCASFAFMCAQMSLLAGYLPDAHDLYYVVDRPDNTMFSNETGLPEDLEYLIPTEYCPLGGCGEYVSAGSEYITPADAAIVSSQLYPPSLNWNVTNLNEDGFPAGVFSFDYVWGLYTLVTMAIAICPISFGMCNSCYQVVTKDDDDTSDIKLKPKKGGSSSNA